MPQMPPPKPQRPPSRFKPPQLPDIQAVEDVVDNAADLKGPLSTIPSRLLAQPRTPSVPGSEGAQGVPTRQTDAISPVAWDQYFDRAEDVEVSTRDATFRVYFAGSSGPVLFCLHGGGYTGLTWALIAARLNSSCQMVAMDMRGHGETSSANDSDLSAETLTQDAVALWKQLYANGSPPTVLVGHSVGGAIAVRTAATKEIASLQGVVVIDVVEGTAIAALPHMQHIVQNRPASFPSLATAVAWAHHSGVTKSKEAAAVSLPSQLKKEKAVDQERWVWRTNLQQSSPSWEGWYRGLSQLFLGVSVPKILMLAGTDRLDKTLTIGQMQGKFQMVLLPQAGHAVHEDEADRSADVLSNFLQRFHIGQQIPLEPGKD